MFEILLGTSPNEALMCARLAHHWNALGPSLPPFDPTKIRRVPAGKEASEKTSIVSARRTDERGSSEGERSPSHGVNTLLAAPTGFSSLRLQSKIARSRQ